MMPGENDSVQLHGLCDASEKAYAVAVYVRAKSQSGNITVSLISSKSKVAPVNTVSIPRLELCGALLLAELMESVQESLTLEISEIRAWTDSTIVLAWLDSSPSRWKTFVANPADCASRGIFPEELCAHSLWWRGPK